MKTLYRVPNKDYFEDYTKQKYTIKKIAQMIREGNTLKFSTLNNQDRTLEYLTLIAFNDLSKGRGMVEGENGNLCQFIFALGYFLGMDKVLEIIEDGGAEAHLIKNKHDMVRSEML